MRKLEESSWLAQIIVDHMAAELEKHGASTRWMTMQTLLIVVREADDKDNDSIFYTNYGGKRGISINRIPSLTEYGTNFDLYGMQAKLRGLSERYTTDEGNYTVVVKTTHDLNSCEIVDLHELLYQMNI